MVPIQDKDRIRQDMRRRRSEYIQAEESSRKMTALLLDSPLYQKADCVLAYVPFRNEPDITAVLERAAIEGKEVGIPQMVGPGIMIFRRGDHPERWIVNRWGIREPDSYEEKIIPGGNTLLLVPGLAFDGQGYRVGYGGGYYDRFLEQYPEVQTVGIAFGFQIVTALPKDFHDRPVQYILSEKELKRVGVSNDCICTR